MEKRDIVDINTAAYWDSLYLKGGARVGSWKNIKPFLSYDIEQKLKKPEPVLLLDIGGYSGYSGNQARSSYPKLDIWIVDISPVAIEAGRKNFPYQHHILFDMNKGTPSPDFLDKFDFILMQDTIEHLKNPIEVLKTVYTWLKKDGILWVNTPHNEGAWGSQEHLHLNFTHEAVHNFCKILQSKVLIVEYDSRHEKELIY